MATYSTVDLPVNFSIEKLKKKGKERKGKERKERKGNNNCKLQGMGFKSVGIQICSFGDADGKVVASQPPNAKPPHELPFAAAGTRCSPNPCSDFERKKKKKRGELFHSNLRGQRGLLGTWGRAQKRAPQKQAFFLKESIFAASVVFSILSRLQSSILSHQNFRPKLLIPPQQISSKFRAGIFQHPF